MSFTEAPDFQLPGNGGERDTAIPRFYVEPVQNMAKTAAEGRPVFDDREFVEINVPGDRKNVVVSLVKEEHKRRWPRHYEAFKAQAEIASEGWPLEAWPGVTRSQCEELKFFKVFTVETLADLPDDALGRCVPMGGFELREKARRTLATAKGAAPAEKLAAELAGRDATITEMKETIEAMKAEIARLGAQAGDPKPAEQETRNGRRTPGS